MPVIYVRVSDEADSYIRELAGDSGLSLAKVVEGLILYAKLRGAVYAGHLSFTPFTERPAP